MTTGNTTQIERLAQSARRLSKASAVRERSSRLLNLALANRLDHFSVDMLRLDSVCDYVVKVIRSSHSDLSVPPHARWRQFEIGEIDRWGLLVAEKEWKDAHELGRAAVDMAFISSLFEGLAGPGWAYAEAETGETFARSEGLAIASLVMFAGGTFSSDPYDPLRVDARALAGLTLEEMADGLQVSSINAVVGLEQRLEMINGLGRYMLAEPELYAGQAGVRPGGLIDYLVRTGNSQVVSAPYLLELILPALIAISPGHYALGGMALGDCWVHPSLMMGDETDGLVPFHHMGQWIAYSLIEPLIWAGFEITDLDGLTGLPDVWNGGLMLDLGLLRMRRPAEAANAHDAESPLVVEWRALTIALLDRVTEGVRRRLGRTAETFPLTCVLEGGTVAAGRRIARERRKEGNPPLTIIRDPSIL